MKSGKFTPEVSCDLLEVLSPNKREKEGSNVYRLIQFYEIPTESQKRIIEDAGIKLLGYIPNRCFLSRVQPNISNQKIELLNIRSVIQFEAKFKLSPESINNKISNNNKSGAQLKRSVKYFEPSNRLAVIEAIQKHGGKVINEFPQINSIDIACSKDALSKIADLLLVQWIEATPGPGAPEDIIGKNLTRSNTLFTNSLSGRHYDGSGVVVALSDDGITGPHIDFQGRITNHTINEEGDHGDMTSGIFVGAGNINPQMIGMATGAKLHVYNQVDTGYLHVINAVDNFNTLGTVITNTSYSQGEGGFYNMSTELVDHQINNNQSIVHVFSAGNDGEENHGYGAGTGWGNITGGMKAGKNTICSGNLNLEDRLESTSSRGPAADGRIKPDICAMGIGHESTAPNNSYLVGGGTSAAAPNIAGVFAQLYQAFRIFNGGQNPATGLLKAALLNTADDLGNPGPDFLHGWGRINGLKAVRIIEENRYFKNTITQGENQVFQIPIPANVSQARIMLYWMDVAGNPMSSIGLINDLNMELTTPENEQHLPLVLDPTPNPTNLSSQAVEGIDFLNNMEQIRIDQPSSGDYTINIDGFAIPEGPQEYFVLFDFIYDEVELTYPLGGEGMVPGESEYIRWDANETDENFSLSYSLDGGNTYTLIFDNIPNWERNYIWTVPDTMSNNVMLQLTRADQSDSTDEPFTIVNVPDQLEIVRVCPDTIALSWSAVDDVEKYEISMLGDMYMDSIGVSNDTTFLVPGLNPTDANWFSVRSILDSGKGRRAIAVRQAPGIINCILDNDVEVTNFAQPLTGFTVACAEIDSSPVILKIINKGLEPSGQMEVNYQLEGGNVVTEIFEGTIEPGETIDYEFKSPIGFSNVEEYEIMGWVKEAKDQNTFNDTSSVLIDRLASEFMEIPHEQNFNDMTDCQTNWENCVEFCELSDDYQNIINDKWDDTDWRLYSGQTPLSEFFNTGTSSGDYDMNGDGKYLYLESAGTCYRKEARLILPCIDLAEHPCTKLSFAYLMYGINMGSLHVDMLLDNVWLQDIIPPVSGNQGESWKILEVDLSNFEGEVGTLMIRGKTGNGLATVMVIDAISIQDSKLIAGFDFEQGIVNDSITFTANIDGQAESYSWDFGDGNTSDLANPNHIYEDFGDYEVTLIVSNSCGMDTITQIVNYSTSSITEFDESAVQIFPNPTSGLLHINLSDAFSDDNIRIKVFDTMGNLVFDFSGDQQHTLDLNALPSGIYLVQLSSQTVSVTKKIELLKVK